MSDSPQSQQQANGYNIVQAEHSQVTVEYIQQAVLEPISATAPPPPWYFIGRHELIEKVISDITSSIPTPVIALHGMGGIGKTALAKQIADKVKDQFPGGIFWGDELPLMDSNPSIILKQWGRLCGQNLEKESDENLPSVLRGLLIARQSGNGKILIIIDDARLDWLGGGVSFISQALPLGVPLIITTRQTQVAQEIGAKIYNLNVLPRAESCELLISLSEKKISKLEAKTVSELCGDMPLALTLMGNLAKSRQIKWLLKRLRSETSRLSVLKLDELSKKEQSVKISLDISYQALAQQHPETALIFRYFAAFARPTFIIFDHLANTLSQTLKQRSPNSEIDYLKIAQDELLRLVDWSLLQKDEAIKGGEIEYFYMHTLLHEYAQSILVDTGEAEEAIRNHILYCVTFADANPEIDLQKHQRSTVEFERAYGQLLQALTQIKKSYLSKMTNWENKPQLTEQIITLVSSLDNHWQFHSQFAEQVEWFPLAYLCAGALGNTMKQADFARRLGRVLGWQGKLDEGLKWMKRSEESLGNQGSGEAKSIEALIHIHRASIRFQQGEFEKAEEDCLHGIELVSINKQPRIYAEGYNLLGAIRGRTGRLSSAIQALEKSVTAWKQVGDRYQIFRVEDNIRTAHYYLGDIANAREAEEKSLRYWSQFPDRMELAMAITNRGLIHYQDQEYDDAIRLQKRAIEISDRIGVQRMRAMTRVNIAWPFISVNKYDDAERILKESLEIQNHYDTRECWIEAHRVLAEIELGRGIYLQAVDLAQNALDLARKGEEPLEEGAALRILGEAHHLGGDLERAKEYLESSLAILRANELKYEAYLTLQALIKLYKNMEQGKKAREISNEAQDLLNEMGLKIQDLSFNSG